MKDGKKLTLNLARGYGTVQIDDNFVDPTNSLLFRALKETVKSNERVLIKFEQAPIFETRIWLPDGKGGFTHTDTPGVTPAAGLTLASDDLTKRINGGPIVPSGGTLSITSTFGDASVIALVSHSATPTTVAHELLGHFYIASKGLPFGHNDSLTGKGIIGSNGQAFSGTVIDFISKEIEPEAKTNFAANAAAAAAAAPKPRAKPTH